MPTIAFDLDETLGTPLIQNSQITGFVERPGSSALLAHLALSHTLILWTVSSRAYVDKTLPAHLRQHFRRLITSDDHPASWKDLRTIPVDFLIDDSPHHRTAAASRNLPTSGYILIPSFGSPPDLQNPNLWLHQIHTALTPPIR